MRETPHCWESKSALAFFMDAGQAKPHFSIPSLIAIGAAIASFFVGAGGGFILALVAIFFGIVGVAMSLSPSVRGGFVSIFSMLVAAVAIIVAIAKAIAWAL
jgi:hypothetical protein